jgi:hypothetical protein
MGTESFDVFCPKCVIQTEARVIASGHGGFRSESQSLLDEVDTEYHGDVLYIARCRRCNSPFLLHQSLHSVLGEFETVTSEELLYPQASRLPLEGVPQAIDHAYQQALRCYAAASYDASAMMCRRSLEALCAELGEKKGSLQSKLDALHDLGKIDSLLIRWAHGVRALGNEAAHDTHVDLSREDARDALDFTEALLLYVFVLARRFDAFSERRKKPASP